VRDAEERLSLRDAADALGISEVTARRWIKSGKLKAYQPGRKYLIPESAIEELLEEAEAPKARAPRSLSDFLRAHSVPAEELSDEELEEFRRVVAGDKPQGWFVDEAEELALRRVAAELAEETRKLRAKIRNATA
jgi:excisionase family DNA binding protein